MGSAIVREFERSSRWGQVAPGGKRSRIEQSELLVQQEDSEWSSRRLLAFEFLPRRQR